MITSPMTYDMFICDGTFTVIPIKYMMGKCEYESRMQVASGVANVSRKGESRNMSPET